MFACACYFSDISITKPSEASLKEDTRPIFKILSVFQLKNKINPPYVANNEDTLKWKWFKQKKAFCQNKFFETTHFAIRYSTKTRWHRGGHTLQLLTRLQETVQRTRAPTCILASTHIQPSICVRYRHAREWVN